MSNNQDKKMNYLIPLEGLEENPVYKGSTALVKYVEREGRKPKGISSVLEEQEPIERTLEGRKEKDKSEDKKGLFGSLTNLFSKDKKDNKSKGSEINYEELGYPKRKKLPVDIEIVEGEEGVYFNIEKWLEYRGFSFVTKVIPLHLLDKLTYNKKMFDMMAPNLRDELVAYNKMEPEEQYKFDRKYKAKVLSVIGGFLISIALVVMFSIVPSQKTKGALSQMRSGEYQKAYTMYQSVSKKSPLASFYEQYSFAMGNLQADKFDVAKEELMKLEGYTAPYVNLDNAMNEIIYKEATYFYEQGLYAEAANNLKLTYNYKDSKARFLEASYMSLDELMTAEKFEEAMKMLSLVGDYKDAQSKGRAYMEKLYQEAQEKYSMGLFSEAEELFFYLAQNNYKDSRTMIYQAQYNSGLEFYKKKKYDEAIEQLSKISWFKDSSAMLSDMYYTKGNALIDSDPVRAYDSFINCLLYRDTMEIMQKPQLVLYGEWAVVGYNGSSVSDVRLSFTADNELFTNNEKSLFVNELSFSGNGKSNKYKFEDGVFTTKEKDNALSVVAKNINQISIVIEGDGTLNELELTRTRPIEKSNVDVFTSVRDSFYNYIDKKIEGGQ